MFLEEQGKESLNTRFLQEEGHGLPAVEMGGEGKVHTKSQISSTPERAQSQVCSWQEGRQQTLSIGIAKPGLGKASLKGTGASQQWRGSPPTSSCCTAGAPQRSAAEPVEPAPAASTALKLAGSKEPGWSRGWALDWELASWAQMRDQSLSAPAQRAALPLSALLCSGFPDRGGARARLAEQRTSCSSKTNAQHPNKVWLAINFYGPGDSLSGALGWREWVVGRGGHGTLRAGLLKYLMAPSQSRVRADGINTPGARPTRGNSCHRAPKITAHQVILVMSFGTSA